MKTPDSRLQACLNFELWSLDSIFYILFHVCKQWIIRTQSRFCIDNSCEIVSFFRWTMVCAQVTEVDAYSHTCTTRGVIKKLRSEKHPNELNKYQIKLISSVNFRDQSFILRDFLVAINENLSVHWTSSGWASTSKHFVLVLVSDSASSNLKMVNMGILRSRPSNAFVLHRLCSMILGLFKCLMMYLSLIYIYIIIYIYYH